MNTGARAVVSLWIAAVSLLWGSAAALPAQGSGEQSSAPSPDLLGKRRLELFVRAGQQPLKQMGGDIFQFATDSERCRVDYGSKACGLSTQPLKGGESEQVFDYYVRQPTNAAIEQHPPSVHKEDWDWSPNPASAGQSNKSRDDRK
jgi:hypothetical protein